MLLMIGRFAERKVTEIPKCRALAVAAVLFVVFAALIGFCGIQLGYPRVGHWTGPPPGLKGITRRMQPAFRS